MADIQSAVMELGSRFGKIEHDQEEIAARFEWLEHKIDQHRKESGAALEAVQAYMRGYMAGAGERNQELVKRLEVVEEAHRNRQGDFK